MLALAMLAFLQFIVAWASLRFVWVKRIAKSQPRTLLSDRVIDDAALRDERVTHDEILVAVRGGGHGGLAAIAAVVLETDGSFSVIARNQAGSRSALPTVTG